MCTEWVLRGRVVAKKKITNIWRTCVRHAHMYEYKLRKRNPSPVFNHTWIQRNAQIYTIDTHNYIIYNYIL